MWRLVVSTRRLVPAAGRGFSGNGRQENLASRHIGLSCRLEVRTLAPIDGAARHFRADHFASFQIGPLVLSVASQ
jgi:hypothetical protein